MTILRKVEKSDNALLAQMIRKVFHEFKAPKKGTVYSDPTTDHLYELFQQPKSVLWVAEVDGVPMGCCGIYPTEGLPENCVELVKFYLALDIRGHKIGKILMEKSIDSAKELGYTQIYLESLPHYALAINMYEKNGFKHLEAPLGNSGHSTCNIWMLKAL